MIHLDDELKKLIMMIVIMTNDYKEDSAVIMEWMNKMINFNMIIHKV